MEINLIGVMSHLNYYFFPKVENPFGLSIAAFLVSMDLKGG